MGRSPRSGIAGFSLLELLLVAIVVAFFTGLTMHRVVEMRKAVEPHGVAHVVGTLRSALGIHVAVTAVREGGLAALADLDGSNPMRLLDRLPPRYLGEFEHPDPAKMPPYSWYFDQIEGVLVYRVGHTEPFESDLPGPARARFRVTVRYEDDRVAGIDLFPMEPFRWRDPDAPAEPNRSTSTDAVSLSGVSANRD